MKLKQNNVVAGTACNSLLERQRYNDVVTGARSKHTTSPRRAATPDNKSYNNAFVIATLNKKL